MEVDHDTHDQIEVEAAKFGDILQVWNLPSYQGDLGSILWSQFSAIFGEKIGVFLKNQCYDQFFA
jgi:hypothetical protein